MKKLAAVLILGLAIQSLFGSVAGAKYVSSYDSTLSLRTGLNLNLPLNTGELTFELQEGLHDTLKSTTNLEVDHYYYWIEVDGQQILGIDPAAAMF